MESETVFHAVPRPAVGPVHKVLITPDEGEWWCWCVTAGCGHVVGPVGWEEAEHDAQRHRMLMVVPDITSTTPTGELIN